MRNDLVAADLFSGAGGFTEGSEQAEVPVVYAANHWLLAVKTHHLNHPKTHHEVQDLRQADFSKLRGKYNFLLASPACQGHSEASQPKRRKYHDELRSTAFAVIDCAEASDPDELLVENVVPFRRWKLFPHWKAMLQTLGYHVNEYVVTATDFGVPQLRQRLFIHGSKRKDVKLHLPKRGVLPAFAPCVDWNADGWRPIKEATLGAQARFAKARKRLGYTFLSQHVTGHPGVGLDEPIRTITCANQHWALVHYDQYRYLTERELARGMSFRDSYKFPEDATSKELTMLIGNAVPPKMARGMIRAVAEAA